MRTSTGCDNLALFSKYQNYTNTGPTSPPGVQDIHRNWYICARKSRLPDLRPTYWCWLPFLFRNLENPPNKWYKNPGPVIYILQRSKSTNSFCYYNNNHTVKTLWFPSHSHGCAQNQYHHSGCKTRHNLDRRRGLVISASPRSRTHRLIFHIVITSR